MSFMTQPSPKTRVTLSTAVLSAVIVAVLGVWGAWQRRWMSDDGLIVLRTVRNLLAGNGPVFNAGERVEANTSVLWQYLIYLGALLTPARLETIALWLALSFTTAALAIAAFATSRLYRTPGLVFLPVGGLIYISLPPARDFATSGLEWGLCLLWIAVLWALLIRWVGMRGTAKAGRSTYWLAFWAGLSWLVRPELALYGGLVGLVVLIAADNWKKRGWVFAAAVPLPLAYQIFRMGYYGLLVPQTAVAKSASDAAWGSGWDYVTDLFGPYTLWVGLLLAAVSAGLALRVLLTGRVTVRTEEVETETTEKGESEAAEATAPSRRMRLRTPLAICILMWVCGLLHSVYVVRVGGDFMHGRMLLLPLFTLLLPISVVPLWEWGTKPSWHTLATGATACGLLWWGITTVLGGHNWSMPDQDSAIKDIGIVDEREFWISFSRTSYQDPPLYAEDFLSINRMNGYQDVMVDLKKVPTGAVLPILASKNPETFDWILVPRVPREIGQFPPEVQREYTELNYIPPTVTFLNLGMTAMNAPLEVRVLDSIGLATPLAARQPRIENGRIGHDKYLSLEWQLAESPSDLHILPAYVDAEETWEARQALHHEDFVKLFLTYREPMSLKRFLGNIKFALTDGRTLEFSDDPSDYLKEPEKIHNDIPIAWSIDIKRDDLPDLTGVTGDLVNLPGVGDAQGNSEVPGEVANEVTGAGESGDRQQ